MADESDLQRYRRAYARLLSFYPKTFRLRFRESMEQTFYDVCRAARGGLFGIAFWLCLDTVGGIVSEHIQLLGLPPKSVARAALVTGVVLLIPLWGVIYVDDWNWDWHGFVIAGAFVFSAAMLYEFAAKTMRNRAYKIAVGLAVITAFLVAWSNFV